MSIRSSAIICGIIMSLVPVLANPLRPFAIHSISNTVSTHFDGITVELNVITKKKAGIRAKIFASNRNQDAVLIFDQRELFLTKQAQFQEGTYEKISGREAAVNLFQMLALNPWLHFPNGELELRSPILNEYRIVMEHNLDNSHLEPIQMHLYHTVAEEPDLLSTIEFVDFFKDSGPQLQPKTLRVTDHTASSVGKVHIKSFAYNKGVADYLFERPKDRPIARVQL